MGSIWGGGIPPPKWDLAPAPVILPSENTRKFLCMGQFNFGTDIVRKFAVREFNMEYRDEFVACWWYLVQISKMFMY